MAKGRSVRAAKKTKNDVVTRGDRNLRKREASFLH